MQRVLSAPASPPRRVTRALAAAWLLCGAPTPAATQAVAEAAVAADSSSAGDSAAAGSERAPPLVPYTAYELENGLRLIVHEDPRVPMAAVSLTYHVGSGREELGRTGFAHLFEHVMFEGSTNVPQGAFDVWLEGAGGSSNGFTNADLTGYFEVVPVNALELALFLEADRLGTLLETVDQAKLDGQREVVKNERRERYDNQPYGLAGLLLRQALYPARHPYHWSTIGSMRDLSAASLEDVRAFFRRWYVPSNVTLVVAGAVRAEDVRSLVERHFGDIPPGPEPLPFHAPPVRLETETRLVHEDDVQVPRLYVAWISPAAHAPGDAALNLLAGVLGDGKSSRLYRRLVYELELAQDVTAFQGSGSLASAFEIRVTARPGHGLEEILAVLDEELALLRAEGPSEREVRRVLNLYEARFYDGLEDSLGRALALGSYDVYAPDPGWFEEELAAHRAARAADVREAARRWLGTGRVLLAVVPGGKAEEVGLRGAVTAREENP